MVVFALNMNWPYLWHTLPGFSSHKDNRDAECAITWACFPDCSLLLRTHVPIWWGMILIMMLVKKMMIDTCFLPPTDCQKTASSVKALFLYTASPPAKEASARDPAANASKGSFRCIHTRQLLPHMNISKLPKKQFKTMLLFLVWFLCKVMRNKKIRY